MPGVLRAGDPALVHVSVVVVIDEDFDRYAKLLRVSERRCVMVRDAHWTGVEVQPLVEAGGLRRAVFLADRAFANGVAASARPLTRFEQRDSVAKFAKLKRSAQAG